MLAVAPILQAVCKVPWLWEQHLENELLRWSSGYKGVGVGRTGVADEDDEARVAMQRLTFLES